MLNTMDDVLDGLDHPRIDDEKVVDRYLAGRLTAENEARFEEHLFACDACLAEVEAGDQMRRGLREVVAQDAAAVTTAGWLAWWRRRSMVARSALTTLALLVALAPLVALWSASEGGGPAAPNEPTADLLVVTLGVVRDGGGSVPTVRTDREHDTLLFSLELPEVSSASYRVVLSDGTGAVLWRAESIEPSLYDSLLIAVPSSFLVPGTYRIEIGGSEGTAGASLESVFRITG